MDDVASEVALKGCGISIANPSIYGHLQGFLPQNARQY
jgi:hypothetical protein